jgi:hypothetical protein
VNSIPHMRIEYPIFSLLPGYFIYGKQYDALYFINYLLTKNKEVKMPNDRKNQGSQGDKSRGMQDDNNKSGSKGSGQSSSGSGHSGSGSGSSSGNKGNSGSNK